MLEFQCPHCRTILSIPEQFIGTTGTCRKCNKPITIDPKATIDVEKATGDLAATRPPTLVAFHCEATGPSARKCNITALGGIKFDLNGHEIDQFWSFADPGHLIPPRVSQKTGITDEMIQGSPLSIDVVKDFVQWIGPRVILFSHHAHFDAKFLAATLLKEDIDPPNAQVVDVIEWARTLHVPVKEYRLRTILDYIGYPVKRTHRALESCHGIVAATHYLSKRQAGAHLETDHSGGIWGKLMGKQIEAVNEEAAYQVLRDRAKTLEAACEAEFYEKVRYEARLKRVQSHGIAAGGSGPMMPDIIQMKHPPQWYEQINRQILQAQHEAKNGQSKHDDVIPENAPWEYTLLEASQCDDREEQRRLCQQAVGMGAVDPWPYERLCALYIHEKDYEAAQRVCEQYFECGAIKVGRWADTSLKLLKKLEKLEKKLAEKAQV